MPQAIARTAHTWYRTHLFATQAEPTVLSAERAAIRTLNWKPPAKIRITACMLCCERSIDRITVPKGDTYLIALLGLTHLADARNRKLGQLLRDMP